MVFFLIPILLESLLGAEPCGVDIGVDVDHKFEHLFKDVFKQLDVLLGDAGFALDESDHELEGLLADA
jgi:hypothetical protein